MLRDSVVAGGRGVCDCIVIRLPERARAESQRDPGARGRH